MVRLAYHSPMHSAALLEKEGKYNLNQSEGLISHVVIWIFINSLIPVLKKDYIKCPIHFLFRFCVPLTKYLRKKSMLI